MRYLLPKAGLPGSTTQSPPPGHLRMVLDEETDCGPRQRAELIPEEGHKLGTPVGHHISGEVMEKKHRGGGRLGQRNVPSWKIFHHSEDGGLWCCHRRGTSL